MQNLTQSSANNRLFSDSGELGLMLLQPIGLALVSLAIVWWLMFYGKVGGEDTLICAIYTNRRCDVVASSAELAGYWAYRPFVMWIGLISLVLGFILPMTGQGQRLEILNKV